MSRNDEKFEQRKGNVQDTLRRAEMAESQQDSVLLMQGALVMATLHLADTVREVGAKLP